MLKQKQSIILNGTDVLKPDVAHFKNASNEILTLENIAKLIESEEFDSCGLVIINAHGSLDSKGGDMHHAMQLDNGEWRYTFGIFDAIAKTKCPTTIVTFACYSGACCREQHQTLSTTTPGTLMGFYAPKDDTERKEVNYEMMHKLLTLHNRGMPLSDALWLIAPLTQSFIAYHHPIKEKIKYHELPFTPFDYTCIKNEEKLLKLKRESMLKYNEFKLTNNLPKFKPEIKQYIDWFKDQWFMQMVTELVSSPERREAAIEYLKTVDNTLQQHTMSFAFKPKSNLLDYFKSFNNPDDKLIINGLETIYNDTSEIHVKTQTISGI